MRLDTVAGQLRFFFVQGDFESVKLCDFGVTLQLDENLVVLENMNYVGTEPWSAKEVLEGRDLDRTM